MAKATSFRNYARFRAFLLTWFVTRGRRNCVAVYLLVFCQDLWVQARRSRHNRDEAIHADSPSMRRPAATLFIRFHPARTRCFRIPLWCGLPQRAIDSLRCRPPRPRAERVHDDLVLDTRGPRRTDVRPNGDAARHLCIGVAASTAVHPTAVPEVGANGLCLGPTLDCLKTLRRRWSD